MKILAFPLLFGILLTGCDAIERNGDRLVTSIGNGYDKTRYKISDYIYSRDKAAPNALPPEQPAQQAYCYRLLADTVCYDKPVADLTPTLIASQTGSSYVHHASVEPLAPLQTIDVPVATEPAATPSQAPNNSTISDKATHAPRSLMSKF